MKRLAWLGLALGLYAIALAVTAPATLVDASLERATKGSLRLAEAKGTVWSGAGRIEIRDANRRFGVAREFAWHFFPSWSLLRGTVVCEIGFDAPTQRIPLTLSLSGVDIPKTEMTLPAVALGLAVTRLAPLGLGGDLHLNIASLSIKRDRIQGSAVVQWRTASSALTRVYPLGDYEMRISGAGPSARASLRTLQGPLQLDGDGSWANGGAPQCTGTARVPAQYSEQLAPLLRLVAVARGENTYALQLRQPGGMERVRSEE